MKVTGIIAEYNPFHNGHEYQLSKIKQEYGSDYVIVVMSGDFVQRGAPAVMDKYQRTRMALASGADLVLMMPVYGSLSSAEGFANCGLAALSATGVVDSLCFGCEDADLISDISSFLQLFSEGENLWLPELKEQLAAGLNYPAARTAALCHAFPSEASSIERFLSKPNNLLAFEYLRSIQKFGYPISPIGLNRIGEGYHSCSTSSVFGSATACRKLLLTSGHSTSEALLPMVSSPVFSMIREYAQKYAFLSEDDFSQMLFYALSASSPSDWLKDSDCSQDLANRINRLLSEYVRFSDFILRIKNKSLTYTRISRVLMHILLKTYQLPVFPQNQIPYLRILGFRKQAAPLLKQIHLNADAPVLSNMADAGKQLSAEAAACFHQDLFASQLYQGMVRNLSGACYDNDFRQNVVILP